MMSGLLKGKVALVTGVGDPRSIGFAIARKFAENGARVVPVDCTASLDVADGSEAESPTLLADISDESDVTDLIRLVEERWGRVDVLVNNAGIAQPGRVPEIAQSDFDRMIAVNLRGTFMMSQGVARIMPSGGSIVCIASIAAQRGGGLMGGAHYAASKAGIVGLVRGMARDLGPRGIRVNAVNPGVILTALTQDFYARDNDLRTKVLENIPLGSFGIPEDVACACLFLASELSRYVTGASIDVNGGMHMS